jgi:hypothetical protein
MDRLPPTLHEPVQKFQMFQQLIGGNSFQKFQSFNRSNLI